VGILAFSYGALVLFSGADLETISARHDIQHILAEASGGPHDEKAAYVESQWFLLNRTAICLAGTGFMLFIAGVVGLKAKYAKTEQPGKKVTSV
jgi:hypothetical protein